MILTLTPNPAIDVHLTVESHLVPHGEVNRANRVEQEFAGKGINVARHLARLRTPCVAMAWCGRESLITVQRLLKREHFHSHLVPVEGEVRRNIHLYADHPEAPWKINEPGSVLSGDDRERCIDVYVEELEEIRIVALCGTMPPGPLPGLYTQLVELANERGLRVVIDTSGPTLAAALEGRPWLIKVNRVEAAGMLGADVAPGEMLEAARELQRRGAENVVLTNAAHPGVAVAPGGRAWTFAVPPIMPQVTLGAGDAFLAGMLAAAARDEPLPAQVKGGLEASVFHCTGGRPGGPPVKQPVKIP